MLRKARYEQLYNTHRKCVDGIKLLLVQAVLPKILFLPKTLEQCWTQSTISESV